MTSWLLNPKDTVDYTFFLEILFPTPSITAEPLVFPSVFLFLRNLISLLSFLPSFKCLLSPLFHHWTLLMFTPGPSALIMIYTLMIPNRPCQVLLLSFRLTWLLLWTSIPGCSTNTLNSLSFPPPHCFQLILLPGLSISMTGSTSHLMDQNKNQLLNSCLYPAYYPSTPALLSI